MDQRGLVERARRGDHDAFAELARGAVTRLDGAARLILRDPELARDAVQEALIRAWRDLPGLRDPDRFDAWLHRLTVNACLDQSGAVDGAAIEVELSPIDIADRRPTWPGALADRDLVDAGACAASTNGHRAVVVLHYFLGMPLQRCGGIPAASRIGTVKTRLHRALGDDAGRQSRPDPNAPSPVQGGQVA